MLLNKNGQQVNVSEKINSTTHPKVFAKLLEIKEPSSKSCGNMFHLEERMRIKM